MNKLLTSLTAAGAMALSSAFAAGVNITVSDYLPGPYRLTPSAEDNETEPNTIQAQSWDLERLLYGVTSSKSLTIVGGYDYLNGVSPFYSGDIWIDTTAGNTPAGSGAGNGYQIVNGNGGYEFVISFTSRVNKTGLDFRLTDLAYTIYDLRTATNVQYYDVYYTQNNASNPYVWKQGGTAVASGTATQANIGNSAATNALYSGVTDWENVTNWVGKGADVHYSLTVNLSPITAIPGVALDEAKFTMGCGNDMIIGDFTRGNRIVPDGGSSLLLVGVGFLALALGLRRRA